MTDGLPPDFKPPAYIRQGGIYVPKQRGFVLPSEKRATFPMPFFAGFADLIASATFKSNADSDSDTTSYSGGSFNSMTVGAGADNTYFVVLVSASATSSTSANLDSVTVGGDSATVDHWSLYTPLNYRGIGCATVAWPSGKSSTANIALGFSHTMLNAGICVYSVVANSGAPTYVDSLRENSDAPNTGSVVDVDASGVCLGMCGSGSAPTAASWTQLTEDLFSGTMGSEGNGYSSASAAFSTQQTNIDIECTMTGGANSTILAVSYR